MKYIIFGIVFILACLIVYFVQKCQQNSAIDSIIPPSQVNYEWMKLSDEKLSELFDKRMKDQDLREETEDGYIEDEAMSEEDFEMFKELLRRDIVRKENL